MTVKVLNRTLGTTIETFQIFAAKWIFRPHVKEVLICRPKDGTKRRGKHLITLTKCLFLCVCVLVCNGRPMCMGELCHWTP